MRKLHILVEGQTEEVVVNDVIKPYLSSDEVYVTTSILTTKRPAGGPAHKGGVTSWGKISREIQLLLGDHLHYAADDSHRLLWFPRRCAWDGDPSEWLTV
jgi:hypothetical protein